MPEFKPVSLSLDNESINSLDSATEKLKKTSLVGCPGRSKSARFMIGLGKLAMENESVRDILSGHSTNISVLKELKQ